MSKTGKIHISFKSNTANSYWSVLKTLMDNEWSANKYGEISYMLNGTFDWDSSPFAAFDTIMLQIKKSIENNHETSIDLIWKDNMTVIGLLFTTENYMSISTPENTKMKDDKSVVDFPFYLEKLSSILSDIKPTDIECVYN